MDDYDYEDYEEEISSDESNEDSEDSSSSEIELDEFLDENSDNEVEDVEKKKIPKYFGYPFLNSFEKARVLGKRTEQIIAGSKIFVNPTSNNPYKIALQELQEKKIPLIIRRYFGNKFKDISVNSLILLD